MGKAIREKVITDEDLALVWEAGKNDTGKVKGPVTMIAKLFKTLGIRSNDGKTWEIKGELWDGIHDADAITAVTQKATASVWKHLSKSRHHYQGLDKGRNNRLSNKEKRALRHPVNQGRWGMIQADGIYTPWRRKQRAGGDGVCPRCGHEQGDLEHMIWECPITLREATEEHRMLARKRQSMNNKPRCLWTLGHIPADWEHERSHQAEMQPTVLDAKQYDATAAEQKVGTDGGGKNNIQVGYGITWKSTGTDVGLPVLGSRQTAQRAEVNAIAEAVARTKTPIHMVTDNKYVKDTTNRIKDDTKAFWGKHGDLWQFVQKHKDRITDITWIKSHLKLPDAIAKGFSEEDWRLNDRADKLATRGANGHACRHTLEDQNKYKLARKYKGAYYGNRKRRHPYVWRSPGKNQRNTASTVDA